MIACPKCDVGLNPLAAGVCPSCALCWCHACEEPRLIAEHGDRAWLYRSFVICADCGNKRCPKANHHDNACTRSNEPGQKGSRFE